MTGRNPWVVLGVPEDAPYHQIQRQFRRRVKQTHPDNGGDASDFAAVVEAVEAVRQAMPLQYRRCPASPTPYDGWLRPCRPMKVWGDEGHPVPAESCGFAGTWATPPVESSVSDFADVLFSEISKIDAAGCVVRRN